MLKTMLLLGAAAISFPALAQEQPVDTAAPPASQPSEPVTEATDPVPDAAPPAPAPMNPPAAESVPPAGETAAQPTPAPAPETTSPPAAEPAPPTGETAATSTQVAQIIDREFPTYDADSSGELSETEFAGWMKKLRAANEPTVDVESAEVQTWISQAWSAADTDKNGAVSKEELTAFLSKGA